MLIPAMALLVALLIQPACLLYTRSIMREVAGETARAALTAYEGDVSACVTFAKRRLSAVPEVSIFHVGGPSDWQVEVSCDEGESKVEIVGHARPLPLMGVLTSGFSESDDTGVVLRVEMQEQLRPSWVGGDYGEWQGIWG